MTGWLDDTQLRELEYRLGYLRELEDRRATVLKAIEANRVRSCLLPNGLFGEAMQDLYSSLRFND